mgnify:CR=1 FL=1
MIVADVIIGMARGRNLTSKVKNTHDWQEESFCGALSQATKSERLGICCGAAAAAPAAAIPVAADADAATAVAASGNKLAALVSYLPTAYSSCLAA